MLYPNRILAVGSSFCVLSRPEAKAGISVLRVEGRFFKKRCAASNGSHFCSQNRAQIKTAGSPINQAIQGNSLYQNIPDTFPKKRVFRSLFEFLRLRRFRLIVCQMGSQTFREDRANIQFQCQAISDDVQDRGIFIGLLNDFHGCTVNVSQPRKTPFGHTTSLPLLSKSLAQAGIDGSGSVFGHA